MSRTRTSARLAISALVVAATFTGAGLAAVAPAYAAVGPRPLFQLPFSCGTKVQLSTYPGHDDYQIDMSAAEGTPLLASAAGTAYRGSSTTGGYDVAILHDNGWQTLYLHLQANSYQFVDGQRVEQGQFIARTGNTGTSTSGPHLHYEQRNQINGVWTSVHAWFDGAPSDITDDARGNHYDQYSDNCQPSENWTVQFADLDGDLRSELLSIAPDGTVVAYRNLGWSAEDVYDGSQSRTVALGFTSPHRVRFADLTGDGKAELITINPDGTVVAYRNLGWTAPKVYDGPENRTIALGFTNPARTKFADLTADGRAELVTINPDGNVVAYRNLGWDAAKVYDGGASRSVALGFTNPARVRLADLTADGLAEIITVDPDGTVVAYRNQGWDAVKVFDGPNSRAVASGFTDATRTKLGDLTGDGKADLVTVNPDGSVVAYRNLGWDAVKVFDGPASRIVATGFII